jgi:hypothetical protein
VASAAASLLCHRHDEKVWSQRSFVAAGDVTADGDSAVFTAQRFIPGGSPDPRVALRMLRTARSTTRRYLDKRGLPRPAVDWDAFKALHDRADLAR